MRLLKKHVSRVAAQTKPAAQRRRRTPLQLLQPLAKSWFRSTERCNFTFRGCGRWIGSSRGNIVDFLEPRLHSAFARRRSRSFVFASSDPKSLTVGVCPFHWHATSSTQLLDQ